MRITDQTGLSGSSGLSGKKKRTSGFCSFTNLKALAREPTSLAIRFSSSSKTSHSRVAKISGRMNSLYFGASFAPRIEHAASQIQDSSDLSLFPLVAIRYREFYANWWPDAKGKLRRGGPFKSLLH